MTELISAMQDRTLPWGTRFRMRVHFLYCECCRQLRDQFTAISRVAAALEETAPPDPAESLDTEAKERLRRALRHPPG